MKILFVSECKTVNLAGGVERIISDFANEFVNRGHNISFVCMDPQKGSLFFPLDDRVNFINLWYDYGDGTFGGWKWFMRKVEREIIRSATGRGMTLWGYQFNDPKQVYFYAEFVKRLRNYIAEQGAPDIILTVHADGPELVQKALQGKQIPIVAMCHADPDKSGDFILPQRVSAWKKCAAVQVLLPVFAQMLERMGFTNVVQIPNPVKQIPAAECRKLSDCRYKIITVGRLEGQGKRQHLLIEAFSRLAECYPQWSLDLYGNVDSKRYLKRLQQMVREYGLEDRVKFQGTTTDIYSRLQKADIFAFPTANEAMSAALTEAMSVGLPVIAYKECLSNACIIDTGKTGVLSESGVEAFASDLEKLMMDTEFRIQLGGNAHDAMREYDPEIVWNKWENVLKNNVNNYCG